MSDYLTHLTNRIEHGGELLPRPRSRFETEGITLPIQEEDAEVDPTVTPQSPMQINETVNESEQTYNSAPHRQADENSLDTPHPPLTIQETIVQMQSAQPPPIINHQHVSIINEHPSLSQISPQNHVEQSEAADPIEKQAMVQPILTNQQTIQQEIQHRHEAIERPSIPITPPPATETVFAETTKVLETIIHNNLIETGDKPQIEPANTINPHASVQTILQLVHPQGQSQQQEVETPVSQPEPVIHVTIGRVEVKANRPQNLSQPKRSKKVPIMSLDEYLKQSRGGHS
ncbi:MAG: hypothetical protein GY943_26140 [Chloroflexi bacterium]|nr:hypothetical protein [Chloroflexota bacterium]